MKLSLILIFSFKIERRHVYTDIITLQKVETRAGACKMMVGEIKIFLENRLMNIASWTTYHMFLKKNSLHTTNYQLFVPARVSTFLKRVIMVCIPVRLKNINLQP